MIFYISEEIEKGLSSENYNFINGLQYLADSRKHGKIEILGDRETLIKISEYSHLSTPAKSIYKVLAEKCGTTKHLLDKVSVYVDVKNDNQLPTAESSQDGKKRIVVSIDWIGKNHTLTDAPIFLCENLDDCRFYDYFGKYYMFRKGINRIFMCFNEQNGGGSTTYKVFEKIISEYKMCLCIVDSDRKFENCHVMGQTAKSVMERIKPESFPFVELHILECHEAENMIPLSLVDECFDKFLFESDLKQRILRNPWKYIDVKEGLLVSNVKESKILGFNEYWGKVFPNWKENCKKCKNDCTKNCDKYIYNGLGENVLNQCVENFFSKNSIHKISERIKDPYEKHWLEIGSLVFSWGVAGEPFRS